MIHRLMQRERRRVKCLNAPTLRKHFLKSPKLHYLLRHHPEGREWREGREGGAGLPKKASRETCLQQVRALWAFTVLPPKFSLI